MVTPTTSENVSAGAGESTDGRARTVVQPTQNASPPTGVEAVQVAPEAAGPDAGTADPTDGRAQYEWQSRYPDEACLQIRWEAGYVLALFALAMAMIYAFWRGIPADILGVRPDQVAPLRKYGLYSFAGMLGGTTFGIKYLYRVVARGYWHVDRRLWRLFSPLTALAVAFAIGALIEASFVTVRQAGTNAAIVGTGFLIGYFADPAVAKLHEVAEVLFGTTLRQK